MSNKSETLGKRKPIKFKDTDHSAVKTIISARRLKMEDAADEMAKLFKAQNRQFLPVYAK